ncbi:16S rRNA (uracil(1498)-N(3))-methyltransferase [Lacrimispora sp. 210928-DFI.3.58]|uniref:16S rRNA (uracil(1498)-N(3))-methyltransferase n=1 Tax=Lacrimispora sp. 210928-DFI.3.58 TaxID=2883214 RepID=UPI0015B59E7A|nr:16S rRNA (uracil(1498)-N(3))-methyltransferase [Lacrimispora sp. 210928-DFI.3.58]MCB7318624.1 16S rRNA (uracil(1498)-N(3))-methyltransferase [Lacrimispora sp. 210928-DFI.3.58]
MHHFFVRPSQVEGSLVQITGPDVNHMKHVLRMKPGEQVLISDGEGHDYTCLVKSLENDLVEAEITAVNEEERELSSGIWLFQGLPKSDKMELIIQKAVELGAAAVVPVATKNAVVKLDKKKEEAKRRRWQAIAESAAKQSKRSRMPEVMELMSLTEAFAYIKERDFEVRLIPYENAEGMEGAGRALERIGPGQDIAVFIGPEGGFDEKEIETALEYGVSPISLGKRILRTETAGLALLSVIMMKLEGAF